MFFFFKQKTEYEMRISDWSSDVCSSDLNEGDARGGAGSRSQAMSMHAQRNTRVDAEMALRVGRVQLVRNVWHAPIDQQGAADAHHLELSLLPNTGEPRGCFPDLWGPQRFEPIGEIFLQIGRASGRVRVCQYVWIAGGDG